MRVHGSVNTGGLFIPKGIDGVIAFMDDSSGKAKRVLVQVKSGHVKSRDIRDLAGTLGRENAASEPEKTFEVGTTGRLPRHS